MLEILTKDNDQLAPSDYSASFRIFYSISNHFVKNETPSKFKLIPTVNHFLFFRESCSPSKVSLKVRSIWGRETSSRD